MLHLLPAMLFKLHLISSFNTVSLHQLIELFQTRAAEIEIAITDHLNELSNNEISELASEKDALEEAINALQSQVVIIECNAVYARFIKRKHQILNQEPEIIKVELFRIFCENGMLVVKFQTPNKFWQSVYFKWPTCNFI